MEDTIPVVDDIVITPTGEISTSELDRVKGLQSIEDELKRKRAPPSRSPSPANRRGSLGRNPSFVDRRIKKRVGSIILNSITTRTFTRWPILTGIALLLLFELIAYMLVRVWIWIWEKIIVGYIVALYMPKKRERRKLFNALEKAKDYEEWKSLALKLDTLQNKESWKSEEGYNELFDENLIRNLRDQLYFCQTKSDLPSLVKYLQVACKNNLGGISSDILYSRTYYGTKLIVRKYVKQVVSSLQYIGDTPSLANDAKKKIFRLLSKSYGRTALCLSGGSTFAFYHLGVIKCLQEHHMLPKVISGTSAGSLVAAMVCVRNDDELDEVLRPDIWEGLDIHDEPLSTTLYRLWKEGSLFDAHRSCKKLEWATKGSTTFLEAYRRTGRILNITVVPTDKHSPAIILNYKTAPNVIIYSAIVASAAIPLLINAVELLAKTDNGDIVPYHAIGRRWRDGSFKTDIPVRALHQLFNVNYTIVCQVNPHIIPFLFESRGSGGKPSLHRGGTGWRGGFIASSLEQLIKLEMLKWLRLLRHLELQPSFIGQDINSLFLQRFHGTCTIYPKAILSDYLRIVSNPTYRDLERKIDGGQRMAWPKLPMIYDRMAIEREIDSYLTKFTSKKKEEDGDQN